MSGLDDTLQKLAVVKADLGLYGEARQLLQEALALQPHPDGSGPPTETMAEILGNLGALGLAQGDYADARRHFERALAMRRQLGTHDTGDGFICCFHLATCLTFTGDYVGARRLVDEVQPYLRAHLGKDDAMAHAHYQMAGTLLMDMGFFEEAAVYHEEALRRVLRQCGESGSQTAKALQSMGQLRHLQGSYPQARPFFDRALTVWRKMGGYEHEVAITINSLGQLHGALGHQEEALRHYEEALALQRFAFGPEHWQVAVSLNNIAGELLALNRLEDATEAYHQSLTIREKVLGADHPQLANALAGLGNVLSKQGRNSEALEYQLKSLSLLRESNDRTDLNQGIAEKNVGMTLLDMSRTNEAILYLDRAVAQLKSIYGLNHRHTEDALLALALAEAASGHERRAFDLTVEAGAASSGRLGQSIGLSSERQRGEHLSSANRILWLMIQLAVQICEDAGLPVPAVEHAAFRQVLRLKGMRAEVLTLQMESITRGHPELAPQIQALAVVRTQMAHLALMASSGQASGQGPNITEELRRLSAQREEIEARLAGQIPELALQRRLQSCDLAVVAAALPSGSVLIEYLRVPIANLHVGSDRTEKHYRQDRYVAFVLPAARPVLARLINLGDAARIDTLVSQCRDFYARPPHERSRDLPDPRAELRKAVFDPLLFAIGGSTRLLVAPDVGLAMFPLECLPSASGEVLLDDYQISYLTCGRDLLRFQDARPGQSAPPVVIAAPDFDLQARVPSFSIAQAFLGGRKEDARRSFFKPLPSTRAEGNAVSALLKVQPWMGQKALKEPLKLLRSPRVLHFATHGMHLPHPREPISGGLVSIEAVAPSRDIDSFLENALYRSALALAGANTWLRRQSTPPEAGNGLLTAEEVCSMNLLDTDLVVLSACETGIGDLQMGEGVLGMRWAFNVAGARALVASLWRVDDRATCALMIEFYSQFRTPQPVDVALRAAQQSLRRRWPDPYFWGAFICQGDPGLLPRLEPSQTKGTR